MRLWISNTEIYIRNNFEIEFVNWPKSYEYLNLFYVYVKFYMIIFQILLPLYDLFNVLYKFIIWVNLISLLDLKEKPKQEFFLNSKVPTCFWRKNKLLQPILTVFYGLWINFKDIFHLFSCLLIHFLQFFFYFFHLFYPIYYPNFINFLLMHWKQSWMIYFYLFKPICMIV